jgi:hypothetical protein
MLRLMGLPPLALTSSPPLNDDGTHMLPLSRHAARQIVTFLLPGRSHCLPKDTAGQGQQYTVCFV